MTRKIKFVNLETSTINGSEKEGPSDSIKKKMKIRITQFDGSSQIVESSISCLTKEHSFTLFFFFGKIQKSFLLPFHFRPLQLNNTVFKFILFRFVTCCTLIFHQEYFSPFTLKCKSQSLTRRADLFNATKGIYFFTDIYTISRTGLVVVSGLVISTIPWYSISHLWIIYLIHV